MTHHEFEKQPLYVGLTATALAYRACVIQTDGSDVSICRAYASAAEGTDWQAFITTIRQDYPDRRLQAVLGFDDGCVGFYQFEVPAVADKQMAAVVAAQAEIHLPLPIEQMQFDWHIIDRREAKATVSVAAARRVMLSRIINQAQQADVETIALDSEAVLNAIQLLCDDLKPDFNLLHQSPAGVKLLFVRNGQLAKAVTFNCDMSPEADEQAGRISLLCLDIQNVIAEFTTPDTEPERLFIDGSGTFVESIEPGLTAKGIEPGRLEMHFPRICSGPDCQPDILCLGLALMARDGQPHYHLFNGLYQKQTVESGPKRAPHNKLLAAAVCLLCVLFIAVSYGVDKYRLAEYEKQMNTPAFTRLLEIHRLRSAIARQRIAIPEIIEKINHSLPDGLTVQSLDVRRFRKIVVRAGCSDPKLMYEFAEAMGKCSGVENVRITNQDFNEKEKLTVFALTFDYKHFTDKKKAF